MGKRKPRNKNTGSVDLKDTKQFDVRACEGTTNPPEKFLNALQLYSNALENRKGKDLNKGKQRRDQLNPNYDHGQNEHSGKFTKNKAKTNKTSSNWTIQLKNETGKNSGLHEPNDATIITVCILKPSKIYECEICNKICDTNSSLMLHYSNHTSKELADLSNYEFCDEELDEPRNKKAKFSAEKSKNFDEQYLLSHQTLKNNRVKHSNNKGHKFQCEICKKVFKLKSYLNKHKKRHTDETGHTCKLCGRMFKWRSSLDAHTLAHTKQKPLQCEICKSEFVSAPNLKLHMLLHSGAKPYECDICFKKFNHPSNMKAHKGLHKGGKNFQCQICQQKFSTKPHLRRHEKLHTDYKPYSCDVCKTAFARKSSLKIHSYTHTNDKPFPCNICTKTFAEKSRLNQHISLHKKEQ